MKTKSITRGDDEPVAWWALPLAILAVALLEIVIGAIWEALR